MSNKFFAIDPQGVAHTRTSAHRTYTHTVVVMLGLKYAARKLAEKLVYITKQAPEDHDFYTSMIDGRWQADTEKRHPGLYEQSYWDSEKVKYTKLLGGLDVPAFVARELERAQVKHAQQIADGYYTTWGNVGWCGRHDLAHKLQAKECGNGFERVMILEAQAGKPPKAQKVEA